jgi:hypothetical protein
MSATHDELGTIRRPRHPSLEEACTCRRIASPDGTDHGLETVERATPNNQISLIRQRSVAFSNSKF